MPPKSENEGFRLLEEVTCDLAQSPGKLRVSAKGKAKNEGVRIIEERKYPEPKKRDLSDVEKSRLRSRIERGDGNIYALATEFHCSASQVAGIKAAMQR